MNSSVTVDPTASLTPSELVLLHGEKFAKKAMLGNTELLHTDAKVSTAKLGESMLCAAFLGSDAGGSIRLEVRQKKAMLGLRKVNSLFVDPVSANTWPSPSIESEISSRANQSTSGEESLEVSTIVYDWLGVDSNSPWNMVVEMIKAGLAGRGLLETIEEKRLKVFTTMRYELPQSTAATAATRSVAHIEQMFELCEKGRPEVWKLLKKHIKSAVSLRTESDDMDVDFD
jgi:hypothetical protein